MKKKKHSTHEHCKGLRVQAARVAGTASERHSTVSSSAEDRNSRANRWQRQARNAGVSGDVACALALVRRLAATEGARASGRQVRSRWCGHWGRGDNERKQDAAAAELPAPRGPGKAKGGCCWSCWLFILLGPTESPAREEKNEAALMTQERNHFTVWWVCQTTSAAQGNTLFASRILRSVTHAMNPWALACTGSTPTSTQKTIPTRTVKNRCITQRHLPACLASG